MLYVTFPSLYNTYTNTFCIQVVEVFDYTVGSLISSSTRAAAEAVLLEELEGAASAEEVGGALSPSSLSSFVDIRP